MRNLALIAILLMDIPTARAIDYEATSADQQAYIAARTHDGYSPDATCAAVARYFGMNCSVERAPCFLDGLCRDESRYIITYGRGLNITYLVTIHDPLKAPTTLVTKTDAGL